MKKKAVSRDKNFHVLEFVIWLKNFQRVARHDN